MYGDLIKSIRDKCWHDGWYGPDDFRGRRQVAWARPFSFASDFAFPCASNEQLHVTEHILGFRLPSLLRIFYTQLANGGFGPGAGIRGAVGGYGEETFASGNDETLVKYHARGEGLVDLGCSADHWQQVGLKRLLFLPSAAWPKQFIPICDLGDEQEACANSEGSLFLWAPSQHEEKAALVDTGMNLEQWMQGWLKEESPV